MGEKIKSVGITGRNNNEQAIEIAKKAIDIFLKNNIEVYCDDDFPIYKNILPLADFGIKKNIDMVFSFGGDGTLLKTARGLKKDIPIAGVNCGRLGFLLEIKGDEIEKELDLILNGNYHTQKRTRLRAEVDGKKISPALNEVAVVPKLSGRLIRYELHIDDWYNKKEGSDGVIIATPTGSTGHSLSAGGPIVVAEAEVFIITPINPLDWSDRPIVISDKNVVRIDNFKVGSLEVIVDGQERYGAEEKIEVKKAESVRIVRTKRAFNKLAKIRSFICEES
ncbi:MAG: NAD(+)/NADH kinase [Candidatus Diapherotrites archaeon]|nr:NAD(+)/NADH kinase [Candidatus Diapherotrites archaeon]